MSTAAAIPQKSLIDYVPTWLPVLVAIFSLVAFGVRADAQIRDLQEKAVNYDKMMIDRTDRMARVETKLDNIEKVLVRLEQKADHQ